MGFMGQKAEDISDESVETPDFSNPTSPLKDQENETDSSANRPSEQIGDADEANKETELVDEEAESEDDIKYSLGKQKGAAAGEHAEAEVVLPASPGQVSQQITEQAQRSESSSNLQKESSEAELSVPLESEQPESTSSKGQVEVIISTRELDDTTGLRKSNSEQDGQGEITNEVFSAASPLKAPVESAELSLSDSSQKTDDAENNSTNDLPVTQHNDVETSDAVNNLVAHQNDMIANSFYLEHTSNEDSNAKEHPNTRNNSSDIAGSAVEMERVKKEMKMMENALQGAAKQAQAKADEIAKLMNENEQLKAVIDDLRSKTNEAEIESLREEYHQRVDALERKIWD